MSLIELQHLVAPITSLAYYGFNLLPVDGVLVFVGTKYVLLIVEHFSKWIEFITSNSSSLLAATILDHVLACFGAPAEVLADQIIEFLCFSLDLCTNFFLHRTTSQNHPELDGLIKRVAQMVKRGFLNINHCEATIVIGTIFSYK